jgi:hypothetical protein
MIRAQSNAEETATNARVSRALHRAFGNALRIARSTTPNMTAVFGNAEPLGRLTNTPPFPQQDCA